MVPIAFVENHVALRGLMTHWLESQSFGYKVYQYDNGQDFVDKFEAQNYQPAIVLMDIRMPFMNGYETTTWLKKHHPNVPVLVFSDIETIDAITAIIRCGANGYTSKRLCCEPNHLHLVITQMMEKNEYFDSPDIYESVKRGLAIDKKDIKEGIESLSKQELVVIKSLVEDKTKEENASHLSISPHTYKNHLKKVFTKLGVDSTNSLFKCALSLGLIEA